MNMQLSKTPIGLDGVPAAETVLSHVDGERGELIIAGERVGDLARKTGFEGVTARLWSGGTGQPVGEAAVRAALRFASAQPFQSAQGFLGQVDAALAHDAVDRLPALRVPTLVAHGALDQLAPAAGAERHIAVVRSAHQAAGLPGREAAHELLHRGEWSRRRAGARVAA